LKIEVGGHTGNVGAQNFNQKFSMDRANAVTAALIKRGFAADRPTAKGYGQTSPIADNRTEEGRAKNRRRAGEEIAQNLPGASLTPVCRRGFDP